MTQQHPTHTKPIESVTQATSASRRAEPVFAPPKPAVQPLSHNQRLGAEGEAIAAGYLRSLGCEVLDRNWRAGRRGELDLIVSDNGCIVAVEVKTRSGLGYGNPFEAITACKAGRLRRLLIEWVREHRPGGSGLRVDAISVLLQPGQEPRLEHLRGIE